MPYKFNFQTGLIYKLPDMAEPIESNYPLYAPDMPLDVMPEKSYPKEKHKYREHLRKLPIYQVSPELWAYFRHTKTPGDNNAETDVIEGTDFKIVHDYPIGESRGTMAVTMAYVSVPSSLKVYTNCTMPMGIFDGNKVCRGSWGTYPGPAISSFDKMEDKELSDFGRFVNQVIGYFKGMLTHDDIPQLWKDRIAEQIKILESIPQKELLETRQPPTGWKEKFIDFLLNSAGPSMLTKKEYAYVIADHAERYIVNAIK